MADFLYFFNQPAQVSQNQSARASSPRSGKYFSGEISFLRLLFISVPSIQYYEYEYFENVSVLNLHVQGHHLYFNKGSEPGKINMMIMIIMMIINYDHYHIHDDYDDHDDSIEIIGCNL